MVVRKLNAGEYDTALTLAYAVFLRYEAPDYSPEGIKAFYDSIHDADYLRQLCFYGAFDGDRLVGTLATRGGGSHIALFFVDGAYHRQGIGRQLFLLACADNPTDGFTVNSSAYAVEVYRHLGFHATNTERVSGGVRYTPMHCTLRNENCPCKRVRCKNHGRCADCREHHKTKKLPVYCMRR